MCGCARVLISKRDEKMLASANCFTRMCKHYGGVKPLEKSDRMVKHVCTAFPQGIPDEIINGANEHLMALSGQKNGIIFERASNYAEMELFKPRQPGIKWLR
jgi:hypothetical protein